MARQPHAPDGRQRCPAGHVPAEQTQTSFVHWPVDPALQEASSEQRHEPPAHSKFGAQARPHAPQFFESVSCTQLLPQQRAPGPHDGPPPQRQRPFEHASPRPQAAAEQLHTPAAHVPVAPQSAFTTHWQRPPVHVRPAAQAWPHPPHALGSTARFVSPSSAAGAEGREQSA